MNFQPDFIITVGGTNVTKEVENWVLQDLEDHLSSLQVTVANPDNKYSGKFKDGDKVQIRFGYQGDLSGKATFELKRGEEKYRGKGIRMVLKALDPAHRLTGVSGRGAFENPSVMACMKEIAEAVDLEVKWGKQVKDPPKEEKDKRQRLFNERLIAAERRMLQMLNNGKKGGAGVGRMGSGKKPIKAQKQPKKGRSFTGLLKNGHLAGRCGGMASAETDKDPYNNILKNWNQYIVDNASSESIFGKLEMKGVPYFRAKKCVTVLNVGPDHSGKWYVQGVRQEWDQHRGYETIGDLLRDKLGKEGIDSSGDTDRPMVMHGDPYEENSLYIGERDMNAASQLTVTFGDGKTVIGFDGGWEVQGSKAAGEGAEGLPTYHDALQEPSKAEAQDPTAWAQEQGQSG